MTRILAACAFLILASVSCYESEIPIAKHEGSTIDARLVGDWTALHEDGKVTYLIVRPLTDSEYLVSFQDDNEEACYYARAYGILVGDEQLISVQSLDVGWSNVAKGGELESPKYSFYRCSLADDGRLTVEMVSDELPELKEGRLSSPDDLQSFFSHHIDDDEFFMDPMVFSRPNYQLSMSIAKKP